MPLPPALAARLARRGLVDTENTSEGNFRSTYSTEDDSSKYSENSDNKDQQEEVIAEDYDDQTDSLEPYLRNDKRLKLSDENSDDISSDESYKKFKGYKGCPNKVNVYHDCTKYCEERWNDGYKFPDLKYMKKKNAMLAKYPLPSHWKEIYDPGVGVHYYWEVDSDAVSWLPPSHPRAVITQPVAMDRRHRYKIQTNKENTNSADEDSKSDSDEESDEEDIEIKRQKTRKLKLEAQEKARAKGRKKLKENNLDPMDPASYSDIPRGSWSDGLFKGNEAKTGVDVTVSGPLYQMRPYPNPGAVLKANAELKKSKSKH